MLTRVQLTNYKAIAALDLPLLPLTVLVGPNGAGKTSVLDAIFRLGAFSPKDKLGPDVNQLLRKGSQGPLEIKVTLSASPQPVGPDMAILAGARDMRNPERIFLDAKEGPAVLARAEFSPSFEITSGATPGAVMPPSIMARLSPRLLSAASYSDDEEPTLKPDGAGLASVLADLAASRPERLEEIIAHTRLVIPALRRVRTQRTRIPESVTEIHTIDGQRVQVQKSIERLGHRVLVDMANGDGIPIDHVSEGTVLLLGLFTLLCGQKRPELLLLDDLDRALHPKAQAELVTALRRLQGERPALQILATTHSPYLLDELRFEEVSVLTSSPDGTVTGAPLSKHPDLNQWRDCVRPGELWTARLEDWVAEQTETPR